MARVLVTGGPRSVGSLTPTVHAGAAVDPGDVQQPGEVRESFAEADRDREAAQLDAAAGGEFIDDRLRLRE